MRKQTVEQEEPSQLTTGKFVWLVLFCGFLYLDGLGTTISAWKAPFLPSMKAKRYLSGFMALAIKSEDSYHRRIKISHEVVQWEALLIGSDTRCHL